MDARATQLLRVRIQTTNQNIPSPGWLNDAGHFRN